MSQFSTNESISLEKRIEISCNVAKTNLNDINYVYEIEKCAKWIMENDFKKVCLQFPDYLLVDSSEIVKRIEQIIDRKVYILADTAYESCCIDYTAANHISADAIIHFGATCFSKTENIIPCLKIYEKYIFDEKIFCDDLNGHFFDHPEVVVIVDTPYLYKIGLIKDKANCDFKVLSVEDDLIDLDNKVIVYLGANDRKLMNISLTFNTSDIYFFDPKTSAEIDDYVLDLKVLKRRLFLAEKIKDSNTVGIVISTLAVKNYLKIIERLKTLLRIHSKKYYIISVGKPTVAKLANFPEVDVFVVVGCAMNEIYENREFYKPIVTPFDLECALNPKLQNERFSYDFNRFLQDSNEITSEILQEFKQNDVSLLTGNIRQSQQKTDENLTDENKIALKNEGTVQVGGNFGAGFLAGRSWKGLEQNLGRAEPQIAQKGRTGLAQGYQNETE